MADFTVELEEIHGEIDKTNTIMSDNDGIIKITSLREFELPDKYNSVIAYVGDVNSQIITFQLPKPHEGHNLSECNYKQLKWKNLGNNIEGISELAITDTEDGKIASWVVPPEVFTSAGVIEISISIYDIKNRKIAFSWNTPTFKGLSVGEAFSQVGEATATEYFPSKDEILFVNDETKTIVAPKGYNNVVCTYGEKNVSKIYFQIKKKICGIEVNESNLNILVYYNNGISYGEYYNNKRLIEIKDNFAMNPEEEGLVTIIWTIPSWISHGELLNGTFSVAIMLKAEENRWISSPYKGLTIGESLYGNLEEDFEERPDFTIELADTLDGNEEDKAPSVKAVNQVLNGKVDKTNTPLRVYGTKGTDTDGNTIHGEYKLHYVAMDQGALLQVTLPTNKSFDTTIPTQTAAVCDPEKPYQIANKQWTEGKLAGKLDMVSGPGRQLYAYENSKQKMESYSASNYGGYIAKWGTKSSGTEDRGGCMHTSDPVNPYHCTNKRFVEGLFNPLREEVEFLQSIVGTMYDLETVFSTENPATVPSNALPAATIDKIGPGIKTEIDSFVSSAVLDDPPSGVTASYNDGLLTINSDEYVTDGIGFTTKLSKQLSEGDTYYFLAEVVSGSYDISGEGDLFVADGINAIKIGELFHGTINYEDDEMATPINVMHAAVKYNNLVLRISIGEAVSMRGVPVASVKKGTDTIYTVPEAIRALTYDDNTNLGAMPVYGLAMSDTVYNYLDLEKKQYVVNCQQNFMTGELMEANATIDVSEYLTDEDGEITVAADGEILFIDADGNSAGSTVPSTITYIVKKGAS